MGSWASQPIRSDSFLSHCLPTPLNTWVSYSPTSCCSPHWIIATSRQDTTKGKPTASQYRSGKVTNQPKSIVSSSYKKISQINSIQNNVLQQINPSQHKETLVKCLWAAPPQLSWNIEATDTTHKVTVWVWVPLCSNCTAPPTPADHSSSLFVHRWKMGTCSTSEVQIITQEP